ncbi:chitinase [Burkholderia sp. Nafp2/4-1b]|uniref:chitinase n=1 Tax=Burkholderia sp. Nafp2/4-1b TaxID=2116686 RepID=UPI000EF884B0|nr:chitinase [Burkholderia sp. Nafp2/4-1b]RKT98811.1 chitinase [Burkholderia sp. Nafp2/4-1b]
MKNRVFSHFIPRSIAVGGLLATANISQAAGVYAPYVDVTLYPTPLVDQIGVQQGIQQFTLAFVVAGTDCTPSWGGVQTIGSGAAGDLLTSLSASIASYRAKGGEVSVSFGGANGTPLMQACTTVSSLKTAYQTVIDTYGLGHIDFDIEGSAQQDTTSVARNFQAVAQLQSAYAAKGKPLHVTLTLPAMPTGLTQDGLNIVDAAIANKTVFDAVNLMAMDYGPANLDMGAAAINAAQALYSQLDTAFKSAGQTKTSAQLWQMVGVTPMIGVNDVQGETFTLANAQSTLNAAVNNGDGFIGNWSIGRDQACPNNAVYTSPTCSGIVQQPYAFASIFKHLGGKWGAGVTQDPNYGGSSGGGSSGGGTPWSASQIYNAGATVTYQGTTYQAQWWTQGDVPGQSSVWVSIGGSTPAWSATNAYQGGQCVMYQGAKYCAKWWTQGDTPSAGGVWVTS